jgi:hypothetical protein
MTDQPVFPFHASLPTTNRYIGSVPPEVVSAVLRDPDSPYLPSQIGVFCDRCGSAVEGDYMVHEGMTKGERLGVARSHLASSAGWICDERGDFCPMCSRPALAAVLAAVAAERARQDAQWGEQNHPDGTGARTASWGALVHAETAATDARLRCQRAAKVGDLTWRHILNEEVAEAFAEGDPAKLRAELVQVAAVAAAWIEAIDRRAADQEG